MVQAYDVLVGKMTGNLFRQRILIEDVCKDRGFGFEELADFVVAEIRAEIGCALVVGLPWRSWVFQQLISDHHRGTESTTGVARCGLDPDVFERAFSQEPTVGDAVQRDPSCEAEVFVSGKLVGVVGKLHDDFLGDLLNTRRNIHMKLTEVGLRFPWWLSE